MKVAMLLCLILFGFSIMLAMSYIFSRREQAYNYSLLAFICFLMICTLELYQTIIRGAKIEYGDEFSR